MPFSELDAAAVARSLARMADRESDVVDVFLERIEETELPGDEELPGICVRRDEGFAVRLLRDGQTWLAVRDGFAEGGLGDALRQVARALPAAGFSAPELRVGAVAGEPPPAELLEFPAALARAIRASHAAFPMRVRVRRHRRWLQVVSARLVPAAEEESFFSCSVSMPWGRWGALFPALGETAVESAAASLVGLFRAREAPAPEPAERVAVLGPAATAVLLHEAVAHALESDTLILGGRPESAVGLQLGAELLNVLDDPGSGPEGGRRRTDDEGIPVARRWLLRRGEVRQPLADQLAARASSELTPGAGRRGGRHSPPVPRSTHLEMLPGEHREPDLLAEAEGGLYLPEAADGRLDPLTGEFRLSFPVGYRIRSGGPAEPVGPSRLRGRVAELLRAVTGVGDEARPAGAGWCAKGGVRLPVWATAPAIRLEGVEVGG